MNIVHNRSRNTNKLSIQSRLDRAKRALKIGNVHEAAEIYMDILVDKPGNITAKKALNEIKKLNAGPDLISLINQERYDEVEQILLSTIERDQYNAHFWKLLGVVYFHKGDASLSLQCYNKSLALNPNDHDLIFQIGCDLLALGDVGNSYKTFKHLLSMKPNAASAHTNIGIIYHKIKKFDKAKLEWEAAIKINPEDTLALTHLGINIIENEGDYRKAQSYFKDALAIEPNDVNNFVNMATAYFELGEIENALQIYKRWKDKNWNDVDTQLQADFDLNYSLSLFSAGKTQEAWKLYHNRLRHNDNFIFDMSMFKCPRLTDIKLAKGKTVLVVLEQGIGDQIFFLGLLKKFTQISACKIILCVEPRILSLMQRSFPEHQVVSVQDLTNISTKFWLPYADMGDLLEFNDASKECSAPYIVQDKNLAEEWRKKVSKNKFKVGFTWRSGLINPRRMHSFTYLDDWSEFFKIKNVQPICLEYGDISEELDELEKSSKSNIYLPEFDLKNDFESLAALIANCDLVFGPSTAPVIQASAQGVKSLMFSLKGRDRWSFGRSLTASEYTSPWYKNCRHIAFQTSQKRAMIERVCQIISTEAANFQSEK